MAPRSSPSGSTNLLPWLGIALVIIVIDQFTKWLITESFLYLEIRHVTSFFNLVRHHNPGAAWNFLADASGWQRWFFVGLAALATGFIVWLLRTHGGQRMFSWALSLILGGAIGNVIDRLVHSHVIDFLQFHYAGWKFPSFNVADSAITLGAALLILDELRRVRKAA